MPLQTRLRNYLIVLAYDAALVACSYAISLLLRLGENFTINNASLWPGMALLTGCYVGCSLLFGIYQQVWRYISIQDLLNLAKASIFSIFWFLPLLFIYNRLEEMPRSLPFINLLVMMALLGGVRLLVRLRRDDHTMQNLTSIPEKQKISVLLVGVNTLSESFLRDTVGNRYSQYRVVGLLDNDFNKIGRNIRGVLVYNRVRDVEEVLSKFQEQSIPLQKIIITPDTVSGKEISALLSVAEKHGLTVASLPRLTDFKQTRSSTIPLKKIDVEDLLGRPQKTLDKESMGRLVQGRKVLITGAGGTIGGELARQIAEFSPSHITLYEQSEHHLYLIDMELRERHPQLAINAVIGDVRSTPHVEHTIRTHAPHIVFHAAALKHVPMSELNVCEAVSTNILGTRNVADACIAAHIPQMVLISTDKAVNPTNVMGATKRFAELYIQSIAQQKHTTLFSVIRFGNVLGSTGSVVPLFQRQLQQGGPLTITHPDVTRYFMTVREAVELVVLAAALSHQDHEKQPQGHIYVLDMGQPVKITELAEQMIRLAGLKSHDVKLEFTGLRPGEKLHEELFYPHEHLLPTVYDGILLARTDIPSRTHVEQALEQLAISVTALDAKNTFHQLQEALPEFVPTVSEAHENATTTPLAA